MLDKDSTAPPIPQAIIKMLRGKVRRWGKQRPNWRAGSTDRLPKCAGSFAFRHGTQRFDGDCQSLELVYRYQEDTTIRMLDWLDLTRFFRLRFLVAE